MVTATLDLQVCVRYLTHLVMHAGAGKASQAPPSRQVSVTVLQVSSVVAPHMHGRRTRPPVPAYSPRSFRKGAPSPCSQMLSDSSAHLLCPMHHIDELQLITIMHATHGGQIFKLLCCYRELLSVVDRLSKPKQGPRGLTTEEIQLQEAARGRQRAAELSQKANHSWKRLLHKSNTPPPISAEETCPPGALIAEHSAFPAFGRGLKSQSSMFCVGGPGLRPEHSMPDASMFSTRSRRPVSASGHNIHSHSRPASVRRERSRTGLNTTTTTSYKTPARSSHDSERPPINRTGGHKTSGYVGAKVTPMSTEPAKAPRGEAAVPPLNLNMKSQAGPPTGEINPSSMPPTAPTSSHFNSSAASSRTPASDRANNATSEPPRPQSCTDTSHIANISSTGMQKPACVKPLRLNSQLLDHSRPLNSIHTSSHSQERNPSKSPRPSRSPRPSPRSAPVAIFPTLHSSSSHPPHRTNSNNPPTKSPRNSCPLASPRGGLAPGPAPGPGVRALASPRDARPYPMSPRDITSTRFMSPRDTPGTNRTLLISPRTQINRDLPRVGPSPRPSARSGRAGAPAAPPNYLSSAIVQQCAHARAHGANGSTSAPPAVTHSKEEEPRKSATPRACNPSSEATPRPQPQSPATGSGQLSPANTPRLSGVGTNQATWVSPADSAAWEGTVDTEASARNFPTVPSQLSHEASAGDSPLHCW